MTTEDVTTEDVTTKDMTTKDTTSEMTAGHQLEAAISMVTRWANRRENRRELLGPVAYDLSPVDMTLLRAIEEGGPVRITTLADWQGVDKSTITPQVRRLERRGLLARQPDPSDGRAALVDVTQEGRALRHDASEIGAAFLDGTIADWSPADQALLADLLHRWATRLYQQLAQPGEVGRGSTP